MLIALLLFAPLMVSGPNRGGTGKLECILPRVFAGDEPHYLIQINSLLNDGDLDLANNYAAVHMGGIEAGRNFSSVPLDHHVNWYINGRYVHWSDAYETRPERWQMRDGAPVPTLRSGNSPVPPDGPEYSAHPPGLAFLLAPILFVFRGTIWVEPAALICSAIAVVLSIPFFRSLVTPYLANEHDFAVVAAVTYLGTPIWHYSRTLYVEPYLLLCTLAAFALHLRRGMHIAAGTAVAVGLLLKPSFGIIAVPIAASLILARKWKPLARFCLPGAVALVMLGVLNHNMYGSWDRLTMKWMSGNPIVGATGLLISPRHGLIPFAPAAVAVLAAWPGAWRLRCRESAILWSSIGLYFALLAPYLYWAGAFCYGPRYLVPILPLLFDATPVPGVTSDSNSAAAARTVFAVYGLSVLINLVGAYAAGNAWDQHPLTLVRDLIGTPLQ
jgi:hypothetical protein